MKCACAIVLLFIFLPCRPQQPYNAALLDTLAAISKTNTPSQHFARLYYNAISITNTYLANQPGNVKDFVCGMESSFAHQFFSAAQKFTMHGEQTFFWQQYYADTTLNNLQYAFIGMAAHINGDLAEALKNTYSYDTIKINKRPLLKFQKVLDVFFDSMYASSGKYKKLKRLHIYTLGLDRMIGKKLVLHWRRQQVKLALWYYTNPQKYAARSARLQHTMLKWKKFALNWIK